MSLNERRSFSVADFKLEEAEKNLIDIKQEIAEHLKENPELAVYLALNYSEVDSREGETPTQVAIDKMVETRAEVKPQVTQDSLLGYTAMPVRTATVVLPEIYTTSSNGNTPFIETPIILTEYELVEVGNDYEEQRDIIGEPVLVDSTIGFEGITEVNDEPKIEMLTLENGAKFSMEILENYSFMKVIESDIRSLIPIIIQHLNTGKNAPESCNSIANTLNQYRHENKFIRHLIDSFREVQTYSGADIKKLKEKVTMSWFVDRPGKLTSVTDRDFISALNQYYTNKFSNGSKIFSNNNTPAKLVSYVGNNRLRLDFVDICQHAIDNYESEATEPEKKA